MTKEGSGPRADSGPESVACDSIKQNRVQESIMNLHAAMVYTLRKSIGAIAADAITLPSYISAATRVPLAALAFLLTAFSAAPAASAQDIVSELKLGVLAHDVPILGDQREHGADINAELRFVSPVPDSWVADVSPAWRWMLDPRPNIGIDANDAGYTSQAYFGLTWTAVLWRGLFSPQDHIDFDFSFGPAFNNGHTSATASHASLGSNVLFHPSAELVYWFAPRGNVSIYFEHSSNAGLAYNNTGLDNLGVRLGVAF
jgi:lipid A 3-O-deacylase